MFYHIILCVWCVSDSCEWYECSGNVICNDCYSSVFLSIYLSTLCHVIPSTVYQKTISLHIYLYSIKKKKTWTVISILFKIRLLNLSTLWCDMHTCTKSCKLYQKLRSQWSWIYRFYFNQNNIYFFLLCTVYAIGLCYKYMSV